VISFRYHVVTIVAVFLALGLGILVGTTVVKQSVIDELRNQANSLTKTADQQRQENVALRKEVSDLNAFLNAVQCSLTCQALAGRSVVLVTAQGVDVAEVDGVRRALRDSQATVSGVLQVTSRMGLKDQASRNKLAEILGVDPSLPPEDLIQQAASRLGTRLADGPSSTDGSDLLSELVKGGFLVEQDSAANGPGQIGAPDQSVVVLSGGPTSPSAAPPDFFVPLVTSLVQAGHPVAAAETSDTAYPFVSLVRSDATLDGQVVTVDNGETMQGRMALILGLRDLLDTGAAGCRDFGVASDACGLLPQPSPAP